MASVFARGDTYYVEYRVNGKIKKRSTRVKVKDGIRKARQAAEALLQGQAYNVTEDKDNERRMTLKEALDRVYKQKWSKNKDTVGPLQKAKVLKEILGEDTYLDEIDSLAISNLQDELSDRNISPTTINRYMAVLKLVFNMATEMWGQSLKKPYIPRHKEKKGRLRYLTDDEEQFLEDYLVQSEDKLVYSELFTCLLDTGMRFAELNELQYDDINFDDNVIHCWRNKGDRPRTIPMTDRVYTILWQQKKLYGGTHPFRLSYDTAHNLFTKFKKALGKEDDNDLCIHALRHTCASRLVQRGVELYTVKEILGHSSIQVTEKYAHLNSESIKAAMQKLQPKT